uniref:Cathepsin H n=2 Tax=Ciona savignyi TaxID=51511 RepID=H2Z894_CIOSA
MKLFSFLTVMCCALGVPAFNLRNMVSSLEEFSEPEVSSLECYNTQNVLEQCLPIQNQCATVQYVISSIHPNVPEVIYFCSDEHLCSDPKAYCQLLQKTLPQNITITNCSMSCCSSNGCNKPQLRLNSELYLKEKTVFKSWQAEHSKYYNSQEEEERRFKIFNQKLKEINEFNSKSDRTWTMGLNEYSDLTIQEFASKKLMLPQKCSATNAGYLSLGPEPPAQMNWVEKGNYVTPVKNQGKCGSCWTFSTTGCLESAIAIHKPSHPLISLSEQQLVDCAQAFDDHGCNGGLPSQAFEYIHYNKGLMTEADYLYKGVDGNCQFVLSKASAFVKGVVNITKGSEDEIKQAVGLMNPVSIAFDVTDDFVNYKSGVFSSTKCGNKASEVNHAVLAVGYGYTADGEDYWLVKNSWGPKWGMDGYFRIKRGVNMCGLADCASYPIVV